MVYEISNILIKSIVILKIMLLIKKKIKFKLLRII
jgi:hypothetical protein